MSVSRTIQLTTQAFLKPFISSVEYQTVGVNETIEVVIKGGYFSLETTVAIQGQTIHQVVVKDDDEIRVSLTTASITGSFNVAVDNGILTVLEGGFEVKGKIVLIPDNGTVQWERVSSNVATTLGRLVPTVTTSGWNKGAGFGFVPSAKDFVLEFVPTYMAGQSAGGYAMIGVDNSDPNYNYNTIDYAIYLQNGTNLHIYENASYKGQFGGWQLGDVFSIKRTSATIAYLKNGEAFYQSATPSTSAMVFDCSLYRYLGAENIKLIYFN